MTPFEWIVVATGILIIVQLAIIDAKLYRLITIVAARRLTDIFKPEYIDDLLKLRPIKRADLTDYPSMPSATE